MKYLRLMAIVVATMTAMMSFAKTNDLSGKVIDEKGQPLPFANVVLLSLPDSAFVQGAVTDEQGAFLLVCKLDREGFLKVSCVGYETVYTAPIPLLWEGKGIDTGYDGSPLVIRMKENTKLLGEVTVKAQLPKTQLTSEGLQTNIKGSVLEHVGTAQDVLAMTPGLMEGKEGVEVIGRGAPEVYINGHRMTNASELDRLQSNEIQSVEVITNPGVQYKANVRSVVRIRTIKRQGDGFGFNVNASHAHSLRWADGFDPRIFYDVNYRTGGVDIFGSINYKRRTARQLSDRKKTTFSKTVFYEEGDLNSSTCIQTLLGDLGFNWQIDDHHFVGATLEWDWVFHVKNHTTDNARVFENDSLTDILSSITDSRLDDRTNYSLGTNIYYNGTVGKKLGVDVNFDYYRHATYGITASHETSSMTHNTDVFTPLSTVADLYAAKAVFSYPIWKGQLQAGTEETFTRNSDENRVSGVDFIHPSSSEVKEDNYAGFATYGFRLPEVGRISAGVRYEYVRYKYEDALAPTNNLVRNYGNWFPSVSYSGTIGPVQVMLNYSAKTKRPDFSYLSNAIRYINRYTWQSGNAQLQPQLSHDISLTAAYKFVTLMVNYTRTDDAIIDWSVPYGNEGLELLQPRNLDTPFRSMSVTVNLMPTFGPWTLNYSFGIQPQWLSIDVQDPREPTGTRVTKFNGKPIGFAQLRNTITLKEGWQFELGTKISSKGYTENMYVTNVIFDLTAAVQKKLLKNTLVLRLEGSDLAGLANHYDIVTDFGNHILCQDNNRDTQRVKFSLRYNFNAARSKYRGTGAGQDSKKRL
ncbi:MAG: outer membrane beta-barrel protein [Bacteroidaceae bacterium]|nr:outer membrane beta-barrel protein [Bacteroidaceae bacterium]